MNIAYQGRPGAFSELAARRFVPEATPAPQVEFDDVINAVISGAVEFGVLPVRNNSAGIIPATCRLIAQTPVKVLDELALRVSHAVIAVPGTQFKDLTRIVSHPVALAQCRWFLAHHPELEAEAMGDTAGCVEWVMQNKAHKTAAIASAHTAQIYGASVLVEAIEDIAGNTTSFLLIEADQGAK